MGSTSSSPCRWRWLFAGLLGLVLERVAFRPLRTRTDSNISGLISSLAAATIIEAIALEIWGPNITRFPFGTLPDGPANQLAALRRDGLAAAAHHHRRGGAALAGAHLAGEGDPAGAGGAGRGGEPARRPGAGRRRRPGHRRGLLHLLGAGRRRRRALRAGLQLHLPRHGARRGAQGAGGDHPRRDGLDAGRGAGRLRARAHRGLRGGQPGRLVARRHLLRRALPLPGACGRAACWAPPPRERPERCMRSSSPTST